jgi:2-keto-4-pentenoate hydratase
VKAGRIEGASSTPIELDSKRRLRIETGIGYIIAVDIGTKLRVSRQALTSVESMVPVVSLPLDLASDAGGTISVNDGIAANLGSDRFIVGIPVAAAAAGNPDGLTISLERDGQALYKAMGADVKPGQAASLMAIINGILDQGHAIHRGDLIVGEALGGSRLGVKGRYNASFGPLGVIPFELR